MQFPFVLLAIQLLSVLASPSARIPEHTIHERGTLDSSWTPVRRLEGHIMVPLRIGLKQQNLDQLPEFLMSVSDPASPSFGQHWTPNEVAEMFAPLNQSRNIVYKWLLDSGFDGKRLQLSHNKAWIDVLNATVEEVEELLHAEYHVFSRADSEHIACHSYSVPSHVTEHIDIITPTVQSNIKLIDDPTPRSGKSQNVRGKSKAPTNQKRAVNASIPSCHEMTTPDCLRKLYNITYIPQMANNINNSFGIVSHRPNTYLQSDLNMFFGNFSASLVGSSPLFVSIDGGTVEADNETSHGEDDWVVEYAMTLTNPLPVTLLQVGDKNTGPFISFNEWLDAVDGSYCTYEGGDDLTYDPQFPNPFPGGLNDHSCGVITPPNVISVSQADNEHRLSPFYTQRQCHEYAKLGLMGVTILFGSGDTGVAGATEGYCLDENGSRNLNATIFNPGWPASCPWITSVGGTQLKANASVSDPNAEEVWHLDLTEGFFTSSGGGFSNRFATPNYQQNAVGTFLHGLQKSDPALLNHFNTSGRGFPDLSVIASNFVVAEDGAFALENGVSGSTPVVGAMIALINDARHAAGKKPVGFINPTIYSSDFVTAFNDITSGTNQGCKGLQGDGNGGFKAVPGWDAVTGLGSPRFSVLLEKWLALP